MIRLEVRMEIRPMMPSDNQPTRDRSTLAPMLAPPLALLLSLAFASCERPAQPAAERAAAPTAPATPAAPAPPAVAAADQADPNLRVSKELWPNGNLKYSYEMRKGANGKWARNGVGRAYYESGPLEREGLYKDNARVGKWTYYAPDGKVLRVEDRGEG
jgi:hypothetical protein